MRRTSPILIFVIVVIGIIAIVVLVNAIPSGKSFSVLPTSVTDSSINQPQTSAIVPAVPNSISPVSLPKSSNRSVSIDGAIICLPHLNTSGPQTTECAFGLKSDEGTYYSLVDTNPSYKNISKFPMGTSVEVIGTFTPEISTRYRSSGIVEVSAINARTGNQTTTQSTRGSLHVGQTATIGGLSITLNAVTQDNRCQVFVQCITVGNVVASITVENSVISQTMTIASGGVQYDFVGYKISLIAVSPRKTSAEIPSDQYRLTVSVVQQ